MAATGIGLGIMTMGAMIPLKMMSNMVDDVGTKKQRKKKKKSKSMF